MSWEQLPLNKGFFLNLSFGVKVRTWVVDDGMDTVGPSRPQLVYGIFCSNLVLHYVQSPMKCTFTAGCHSEEYLNYTWPDTGVGTIASALCPCAEVLGPLAKEVTRQCMATPRGAKWSAKIESNCETVCSQQLCDIVLQVIFW